MLAIRSGLIVVFGNESTPLWSGDAWGGLGGIGGLEWLRGALFFQQESCD
jgi:hypothetical protein